MLEGRRPWKVSGNLERSRRTSRRKGRGMVGGLSWELERASSAPENVVWQAWLTYNRQNREVVSCREAVGGGRSSDDRQDNITGRERRAPTSSMRSTNKECPDECRSDG